jgi:hypothetical protein
VAALLRAHTLGATMLWAMNEGGGYPFTGRRPGGPPPLHRPALRRCWARPRPAPSPGLLPGAGGRYSINCSDPSRAADCRELDTNGDGVLSQADDMYSPFYPGDDVVDWVRGAHAGRAWWPSLASGAGSAECLVVRPPRGLCKGAGGAGEAAYAAAAPQVGLSIYHFGASYPYGNNVLPETRKFASKVGLRSCAPAGCCAWRWRSCPAH